MKILSVEPTPSPNSMKLNMNQSLSEGEKYSYTKDNFNEAPDYIQKMFVIDGVKSIYHVADFIAVDRYPNSDWKPILAQIQAIFGDDKTASGHMLNEEVKDAPSFGEVKVLVQVLRGIPTQVKLLYGNEEARFGLPERFAKAVMHVQQFTSNYIFERKWEEQGVRYGEVDDIGAEVVSEISAAYDEERIHNLVQIALSEEPSVETKLGGSEVSNRLEHPDWEKRFAALERLDPTLDDLPILSKALSDSTTSIRRLATVYLGMLGGDEVLPFLYKALNDKSVVVRRTAGDALSDLGNPRAIPAMMDALNDPNKLVRWRAARFLFEVGDESALQALKDAQNDPEFEVDLQIRMAIERIESGEEASGTIWQQMTRSYSNPK